MGDLNGFVPGLVVSSDSPTQPKYQIRGVQTSDFGVGTDSAVGVYVDGVYSARSGSSLLAFNDIERIEVLKGPQGTLFGRNSAAGAVSIVTRQPADEFDGLVNLRLGENNKRRIDGMVNVPLGDTVALRVNGVWNQSDGWVQDAATGKDLWPGGQLGHACRAQVGHHRRNVGHADLGPRPDRPARASCDRPGRARPQRHERAVPAGSRDLPQSTQGPGLQRRRRQRGIAQAGCRDAVHRSRVQLVGLAFDHRVADVRDGQSRGRGRHQPHRAVFRHRQRRGQHQLLPGVQALGPERRRRLGGGRELLLGGREAGERHARFHRQHRHRAAQPRPRRHARRHAVRLHQRRARRLRAFR